jgi:hypothetical protein
VRPEALTEGPAKRNRAAKGMRRPQLWIGEAYIPLRVQLPWKKLLRPPRSCQSLRRLSHIPSRNAVAPPTMTYSEVLYCSVAPSVRIDAAQDE